MATPALATPHGTVLSAPARARRQQVLDAWTAAGLRALTGDTGLDFHGLRPWRSGHALPWQPPHLACSEEDGLLARRAMADGLALRERFTEPLTHLRHAPAEPLARMLYEWFESLRVEALVPAEWPGVQRNLDTRFHDWSERFHDSPLVGTHLGLLLFTVSQIVRARLHRSAPDERFEDTMESTRAGLSPQLGHSLRAMGLHVNEPALFAPAARDMALRVAGLVHEAQTQAQAFPNARRATASAFFLAFEPEPQEPPALPVAERHTRDELVDAQARYRVFSTAFDREEAAASLVRSALLDEYQQLIASGLTRLQLPLRRLARELAQVVQQPDTDGWDFEQEAGRIDARQLPRLLTSPGERRLFKLPRSLPKADAAVTLLIDCSGSMKAHAQQVALFATALNRICALAHIPLEVLGFGTRSWNGGQARKLWQQQRKPAHPGRVADRLHLVFQSADMRPTAARRDIAALLKADLYREGLDGEAVQWASQRLQAVPAKRHVLLVLSDGCPNETCTAQLNGEALLEQHLCDAVAQQMQAGVAVIGIGLGLDLRHFYPHNLPIDADELPTPSGLSALWRQLQRVLRGR